MELAEKAGGVDCCFPRGWYDCRRYRWNCSRVLELGGVADMQARIYTDGDARRLGPRVYSFPGDLRLACHQLDRQWRWRRTQVLYTLDKLRGLARQ